MDPNNNDNFSNESIFESAKTFESSTLPENIPEEAKANGVLGKFVRTITDKLNEYDTKRENKKIRDNIEKIFEQEKDIITLLMEFGCQLQYIDKTTVNIHWEKYNLHGQIKLDKEGTDALDEGAKRIIQQMFSIMKGSDNMENTLDRLESEGFYPVGNLEQQEAIIAGQKCTVLVGTFENNAKETRKIYFYNGREVFLSDDQQDSNNKSDK